MTTIDLHNSELVTSALEILERELYRHFLAGEKIVRIIYGIGEGVLAAAVYDALKKNPLVRQFVEDEAGGSGLVYF